MAGKANLSPRTGSAHSLDQLNGSGKDPESLRLLDEKPAHLTQTYFGLPSVLVSGLAYALSSGCLTLLNKHALAGFGFSAPNALLFFQCALTVVLVKMCEFLGLIKPLQPLKSDLVAVW